MNESHVVSVPAVVVHPLLTPISGEEIEHALAPARIGADTKVLRLDGESLRFVDLAELDWGTAHDALIRDIETRLLPALGTASGTVHYFGMLPIPLAIEAGCRLGPARRIIAHQQRHDSKSWRWPTDAQTVQARLTGIPAVPCLAKGDVIVRVTCSHVASSDDARAVLPHAMGELHVEVQEPHEDVLRSEVDVTIVAARFGEALDAVRRYYPNCDVIHVFAAVPPALAIRLGAEVNPTIHRPLQTYQFSGRAQPRYSRAILVGEPPRPSLSPAQRASAASARTALARSLEQLRVLGDPQPALDRWLSDLVGPAAALLPGPLSELGPVGHNKAIVGAVVSVDLTDANGEFRWDHAERRWIFDDRLLSALAARLEPKQLEQAGRLFFLHEAIHIASQGITAASAQRIGRLPRVLEEADYLADVWALLHEYARAVRAGETDESHAAGFFQKMLRLVTATFWAFDVGDLPLRAVQVRRLNRYLIWYWQRLSLEQADSLADVLRILATKPVLEISGPRVATSRNRVMFDLDPAYFDAVEFGALVGGFRVVRIGARPGAQVGVLLEALRTGDEEQFVAALRGVFDSIHLPAQ